SSAFLLSVMSGSPPPKPSNYARTPGQLTIRADRVDNHGRVYAVHVSCVAAEKARGVVLGPRRAKAIITAKPPAIVLRIPLDAAPDVAGEKGLVVRNPERRPLEHGEATNATRRVRNDRLSSPWRHDEARRVVEEIWRLDVLVQIAELQVGRGRDHRSELPLDADIPIDIERDGRAEAVVAEAGRVALRREECRPRRHVGDFDRTRTRVRLLRIRAADTEQHSPDDECRDLA